MVDLSNLVLYSQISLLRGDLSLKVRFGVDVIAVPCTQISGLRVELSLLNPLLC